MADVRTRLLARSEATPAGCREWRGALFPNGYGKITVGSASDGSRAVKGVHRVAYEAFVGPIPAGLGVLHECDNRPCIEPTHLFVGTDADNARDRERKGRGADHRGEAHGLSVLTDVQVMAIRWLVAEGLTQAAIADLFGLRVGLVRRLTSGGRWGHLPVLPYVERRGGRRTRG